MDFQSDRLLALIEANHTSVPQLSEQLGVTRQLVYRWLKGKSVPGIHSLLALCKMYDVDMEYFFPSVRKNKFQAVMG